MELGGVQGGRLYKGRSQSLQAYFLLKPPGDATPFVSRHLWSYGVALAATVGFKGVEVAMGLVRSREKFSLAPYGL